MTAVIASRRSRCSLMQVGAVVVDRANRVVATGYNGPPAGLVNETTHDNESCRVFCPRVDAALYSKRDEDYGNCVSIHAEANALLFCDRRDREGGTLYVTSVPCWECAKLIANSGVATVVYPEPGDAEAHRNPGRTLHLLLASGLEVIRHSLPYGP